MTENDSANANSMEAEATVQSDAVESAAESTGGRADEGGASGGGASNDDDGGSAADAANDEDASGENGGGNDAPAAGDKSSRSQHQEEPTPADGEPKSDKKRPIDEAKSDDLGPLPTLPLKRARTAYFIFADEKREEVKKDHQGEGVAAIAKAIGHMWSALTPAEKGVYETQSAKERERLSRDTRRLKDAGMWPEGGSVDATGVVGGGGGGGADEDILIFPVGRIRKICKLDPDVKGISKESALLITKATELFCTKLGKECVTMASMQNRRKLMPDDVVEVCSIKERFMFLKPDLVDLRRAQIDEMSQKEKENGKGSGGGGGAKAGEDVGGVGAKTLDSFFGKVRNS